VGQSALDLVIALQEASPSVHVDPALSGEGAILFNPICLKAEEPEIVARQVRALLARGQ
jgi:hypothetical protein